MYVFADLEPAAGPSPATAGPDPEMAGPNPATAGPNPVVRSLELDATAWTRHRWASLGSLGLFSIFLNLIRPPPLIH